MLQMAAYRKWKWPPGEIASHNSRCLCLGVGTVFMWELPQVLAETRQKAEGVGCCVSTRYRIAPRYAVAASSWLRFQVSIRSFQAPIPSTFSVERPAVLLTRIPAKRAFPQRTLAHFQSIAIAIRIQIQIQKFHDQRPTCHCELWLMCHAARTPVVGVASVAVAGCVDGIVAPSALGLLVAGSPQPSTRHEA